MRDIMHKLIAFRNARDWEKYHTPENLAKSITLEAAELLEHFQWTEYPENIQAIKEELADILSYCYLMCAHYGFTPERIIEEKMLKNEKKYPVNLAYGHAKKPSKE